MFDKKLKEKIAALSHELEDLKQIVKTQELIRLREENAKLKEKEALISKVKFKLKDVAYLTEENIILVKYQLPFVKVGVTDDGEIMKNDLFYAINKLQLIPFDDMKKIQAVIDDIKRNKQNA